MESAAEKVSAILEEANSKIEELIEGFVSIEDYATDLESLHVGIEIDEVSQRVVLVAGTAFRLKDGGFTEMSADDLAEIVIQECDHGCAGKVKANRRKAAADFFRRIVDAIEE